MAHHFPVNMQRNISLEAFNTRYERVAVLSMADGTSIAETFAATTVEGPSPQPDGIEPE
jgi:hypothetical protein